MAGGRDMPSEAGVQPPPGAMISRDILGGQSWKGTQSPPTMCSWKEESPRVPPQLHTATSPTVLTQDYSAAREVAFWATSLPAHKQDDTGARSGPSPGGSGFTGPRSQRPESTGLCESLAKPSEGWQKGVNPRLCRWPEFQISLAFTEVELILP